jgi:hypothetical protein
MVLSLDAPTELNVDILELWKSDKWRKLDEAFLKYFPPPKNANQFPYAQKLSINLYRFLPWLLI